MTDPMHTAAKVVDQCAKDLEFALAHGYRGRPRTAVGALRRAAAVLRGERERFFGKADNPPQKARLLPLAPGAIARAALIGWWGGSARVPYKLERRPARRPWKHALDPLNEWSHTAGAGWQYPRWRSR